MKCTVCGIGVRERKTIDEAFFMNGRWVVVEHIPADVCSHCGEITFDANTGERGRGGNKAISSNAINLC